MAATVWVHKLIYELWKQKTSQLYTGNTNFPG